MASGHRAENHDLVGKLYIAGWLSLHDKPTAVEEGVNMPCRKIPVLETKAGRSWTNGSETR